jgi:hypothetical protein
MLPPLDGSRLVRAMTSHTGHANARPRARCHHCGDVIGVYEPLVLLGSEGGRETSVAAEPQLAMTDEPVFHRDCHAVRAALDVG